MRGLGQCPGKARGGPCGPGGSRCWLPQKLEPLEHPPCTQEAVWDVLPALGVGQQGRDSRAAAEQQGSSTDVPECWLRGKVMGRRGGGFGSQNSLQTPQAWPRSHWKPGIGS